MRKMNWLVIAVFAIASIAFLALWFGLGFNKVDSPVDIVFAVCWWAVIVAACIAIQVAERRRQRAVRTAFLAPGIIYNPELGTMRVPGDAKYVDAMQVMLSKLTYDPAKSNSRGSDARFEVIVHSDKFSDDGSVWEGEVVSVSNPNAGRPFSSKSELEKILAAS